MWNVFKSPLNFNYPTSYVFNLFTLPPVFSILKVFFGSGFIAAFPWQFFQLLTLFLLFFEFQIHKLSLSSLQFFSVTFPWIEKFCKDKTLILLLVERCMQCIACKLWQSYLDDFSVTLFHQPQNDKMIFWLKKYLFLLC